MALTYSAGEDFSRRFNEYLKASTARAVPSLFATVKQLYKDPKKAVAIDSALRLQLDSMRARSCFAGSEEEQDPTVMLWLLLFAALHYDMIHDYPLALKFADEAIIHTPTLLEAHTAKARVLKHTRQSKEAAEAYEQARLLDQADRYLNARCSKYLIRDGKLEEAEKMMALFARETHGELNVHEMQCMWYELEMGAAHLRAGSLAKALKMYKYVETHFNTIYDDQVNYVLISSSISTTLP